MSVWSIEVFQDANGKCPFASWVRNNLSEAEVTALDTAIQKILIPNGNTLSSSKWLTPLGRGLYEFRISHTSTEIKGFYKQKGLVPHKSPEKILLRVFVHFYGKKVILILGGYSKGAHSEKRYQQQQINYARKLLKEWKLQRD